MNEIIAFQTDDQFERWREEKAVHIETVAANAYAEIGRDLRDVQMAHKYRRDGDGFVAWLGDRFPAMPVNHAYNMIAAASVPVDMFLLSKNIPLKVQAEIGRSDEKVQAEIAERVKTGEIFTAEQVKTIRREAEETARLAAQRQIADANQQIAEAQDRIKELEADDADNRDEIQRLNKAIAEHAKLVEEAKKSLPSPKQAQKIAAEKGDGAAVLGSDGRMHTGATAEQRRDGAAFMHFHAVVGELGSATAEKPDRIVGGCTEILRPAAIADCQRAIAYITHVMEGLRK